MNKLEEQLKGIFGKDFSAARERVFAEMDEKLADDLKSAIGFDPSPITQHIEVLFNNMNMTYAQRAVVISDLFARSSKESEIAAVVNLRTLESNIAGMLVRAAHNAGLGYEPLIEASCENIIKAAETADAMI